MTNAPGLITDYGLAITIGDHCLQLSHDVEAIICDTEDCDGEIRLQFISAGLSARVDMTVDNLQRLQSLIGDVIIDAFESQPGLRCPACGYTKAEADAVGDHQNCRRYPYFPNETGASFAK